MRLMQSENGKSQRMKHLKTVTRIFGLLCFHLCNENTISFGRVSFGRAPHVCREAGMGDSRQPAENAMGQGRHARQTVAGISAPANGAQRLAANRCRNIRARKWCAKIGRT
jgi:hypothetical protein